MSVLDDQILDPTSPGETHHHHRRDAFSHRDSIWSDFSHPVSNLPSRHGSHTGHANAMFSSPANPFLPADPANRQSYTRNTQQSTWPGSKTSGSCTPIRVYDLDHGSSSFGGAVGQLNTHVPAMSYRPDMPFAPPPAGTVAMSPQSSQGWMPASADMLDASAQPTSPTYRHDSPLSARRDGVRKKNARFEIPAERTLGNIDQLISQSTNEDEVKELKQQKRLLRNRQAA